MQRIALPHRVVRSAYFLSAQDYDDGQEIKSARIDIILAACSGPYHHQAANGGDVIGTDLFAALGEMWEKSGSGLLLAIVS